MALPRVVVIALIVGCGSSKQPESRSERRPDPSPPAGDPAPDLAGPEPEVAPRALQGALPVVPDFGLPAVEPGHHSVKELLVRGLTLRGTEVRVRGYVTWIYSCADAIARPGMSAKQVKKQIDDDPTLCERPKFYLGDAADTPPDASLWVVDVPRAPNKLETQRLPKAELAAWPKVPAIKVGDRVTVTGTFAVVSPHGDANSDGLVVYAALDHAAPGAETEQPAPTPASPVQPATPGPRPKRATVDQATRDRSDDAYQECVRDVSHKAFATAVEHCKQATAAWPGNAPAWWALGQASERAGDWATAVDAHDHAAQLDPDQAMYRMAHGVALYERAVATAREAQAARAGRKPDEVIVDLAGVDLDPALATLLLAVKLEPRLWRAHYYMGRIHRDQDRARDAAAAFGGAITANPTEAGPYIALAELYRRWGYLDEAIKTAELGTENIPGPREASTLWVSLGMAYDRRGDADRAIAAYGSAIAGRADHPQARFQRGLAYFHRHDFAHARPDLESFLKSGSLDSAAVQQANRMLVVIASKRH